MLMSLSRRSRRTGWPSLADGWQSRAGARRPVADGDGSTLAGGVRAVGFTPSRREMAPARDAHALLVGTWAIVTQRGLFVSGGG